MKIDQGLFDHMVLPRGRGGKSDGVISGGCEAAGAICVRVTKAGKPLPGFANRFVGRAGRGTFAGELRGIPAGGPYEVELRVEDAEGRTLESLRARDVLVGDVWVLAGQSNMEGIGRIVHAMPAHPMVRAFMMDDQWRPARDGIHNLRDSIDPVHASFSGQRPVRSPHVGVGPGVSFGQEMFRRTGVPQGLIACAHGGTRLGLWSPDLKREGGGSLYGAMLRRVRKNGARVAGVLWYQGESDATEPYAAEYTPAMRKLVRAMRRDFRAPELPFVMVQIGRVLGPKWNPELWNSIQEQQRRLAGVIPHCAVVPAIDLGLDDGIHINGEEQHRLGRRLAQAARAVLGQRGAGKPPIALRRVRVEPEHDGCVNICVEFDNVMGRLESGSRPEGFAMRDHEADVTIVRVDLNGDCATLRINGKRPGMLLYYGRGTNPYCNITDSADRSLPVLGPIPVA